MPKLAKVINQLVEGVDLREADTRTVLSRMYLVLDSGAQNVLAEHLYSSPKLVYAMIDEARYEAIEVEMEAVL